MARDLTWVYLIKDLSTGFYKIGQSVDPRSRLREIKRQPVLLPYEHKFTFMQAWEMSPSGERQLHTHFKEQRVRGEWFALSGNDLDTLYRMCRKLRKFSNGISDEQEEREKLEAENRMADDYWESDFDDDCEAVHLDDEALAADCLDFAVEAWGYEF